MKRNEEIMMKKEDQLLGIHHVTAMTSDAEKNYHFFTDVLGMRLVKKTVNQDDIYTYHTYYENRFNEFAVKHTGISEEFGKKVLRFWDFDDQAYQLISDELNQGVAAGTPWKKGPVPTEFAIYGLGPVEIAISYFHEFKEVFEEILGFHLVAQEGNRYLLEVGQGGNGAQVVLVDDDTSSQAQQGYGEVHHVAFRLADRKSLGTWQALFDHLGLQNSGYVDRYYFESLYVRIGHILVELATDEPGFMGDEPYETLGEKLSLAPFLENRREYIESVIKPFNTKRA